MEGHGGLSTVLNSSGHYWEHTVLQNVPEPLRPPSPECDASPRPHAASN